MKYERGSFITVPSREVLSGLHPTAQTLYMWLCAYANETGTCYPSRKTLAKNVGCSETMIDNMVDLLVENGLLKIKGRKDGDKQLSNLYTVLIQPPLPHSGTPPTTQYEGVYHDVRTNSIQLTQSNEGGELEDEIREVDSDLERNTTSVGNKYTKKYIELCDWMASLTGVKFVDRRGQFKALKLAREGDISAARLKERAEELWASGRFEQDGMDWFNVVYSFNKKS